MGVAESNRARAKHNQASNGKRSKVYHTWVSMKQRCLNENNANYHRYGGRGITVCKRWLVFENFYTDMGEPPTPQHSLERIDNDAGYKPSNTRWATKAEQANNRATCVSITHNGKTLNLKQWSIELDVPYQLLVNRWVKGERAEVLLQPRRQKVHGELVTYKGKSMTLREWEKKLGIKYSVLWKRNAEGVPLDKPVRQRNIRTVRKERTCL